MGWLGPAGGARSRDKRACRRASAAARSCRRCAPDGRVLVARRLGDAGMGEAMWLLSVLAADAPASQLASAALTPRETEVLSWVAKARPTATSAISRA